MHTVTTRTKPSGTYLTHLFGCGLDDKDHYDVQRFQSMSTGEIRPGEGLTGREAAYMDVLRNN